MESQEMREVREITSRDHTFKRTYDDIDGSLSYNERSTMIKMVTHLGQRKLLLTEIDFLNQVYAIDSKNKLVIYAGSASGEHMPIILDLFPTYKFLMIDPNYHLIDAKQIYIYQDRKAIDAENHRYFTSMKSGNKRSNHMIRIMDTWYRKMPTISGKTIDVYNNVELDEWYRTNNFIAEIIKQDCRIFIIQDYLREDLCKLIRKNMKDITGLEVFLVSDIRTTFLEPDVLDKKIASENASPGDMDVIWNNCLQIIFLRSLEPRLSMLKFHPPYYEDDPAYEEKLPGFVKSDIARCAEICGVDYLAEYRKFYSQPHINDYPYFGGKVLIQAWSPISSSETRLIVPRDLIHKMRTYSSQEWEDRFLWFRIYRMYAFHPGDWHVISPEYDGCQDCQLEIYIIGTYIANLLGREFRGIDSIKSHVVDYERIKEIIDKYTFYSLKGNHKTLFHGCLTSRITHPNLFIVTKTGWQKKTYTPELTWLTRDIPEIIGEYLATDDRFIECIKQLYGSKYFKLLLATRLARPQG